MTRLSKWFKRLLNKWELNALLKELEENLEYQDWLRQELERAQYRRVELMSQAWIWNRKG